MESPVILSITDSVWELIRLISGTASLAEVREGR
jgi:hypothetical protein